MDGEEDLPSFSPPTQPSPEVQHRRLKRLKKYNEKKVPEDPLIDDPLLFPRVDFAKLEALENDSETLDFGYSNSSEDLDLSQQSEDVENGKEKEAVELSSGFEEDRKGTRRALDFDQDEQGIGEEEAILEEVHEKDSREKKEEDGKRKSKKRLKSTNDDQSKVKAPVSNKRREEKERKAYIQQLHAESQRLLRETRDAGFRPIPVAPKPISSVLEKIRKRKLEVSKKIITVNKSGSYVAEDDGNSREKTRDLELDYMPSDEEGEDNVVMSHEMNIVPPCMDGVSSDACHDVESKGPPTQTSHDLPTQEALDEPSTSAFRAPIDDTQDLLNDIQQSESHEQPGEAQCNSPLEEDFAPSLLAMDLKFDSAPSDDSCSDEEDNDKENVDPGAHGVPGDCSSPNGDFAKAFVDDEAEEEDDSDHDLFRFQEEEEDIEDSEELDDIIATDYQERPIDNDKRNELHRKWLEQQDAAGTENLLQKLKYGSELKDTILLNKEPEIHDAEEDSDYRDDESTEPKNSIRLNAKKAKQIITEMFVDKDDVYISDNDDDEAKKRHVKQRLLKKAEEEATLVSPADDESSKEVFGLIKKLNIVSDTRKKTRVTSFFDTMLKGGNESNSSKSSFVGRLSNHSVPSFHKQSSGTFRSFVFGRDDSNSRSSMSVSQDSSETVSKEVRPARTFTAKRTSSQPKIGSQNKEDSSQTPSKTSLFDILRRSSSQSNICNQNSNELTDSRFDVFKLPKKSFRLEGRS